MWHGGTAALGKTGNCQIGVSVHAVTDWASAAIDWRLFLLESWDDEKTADDKTAAEIRARRGRSAIPDEVRHREKWRLALDMLDEITTEWGLPHGRWCPTPATAMPPRSGSA